MKKTPKRKPVRCPLCESRNVYYRVWSDSFLCRACGHVFRWDKLSGRGYRYRLLRPRT